ncbi:hypothetical protein [Cohnella cellulosilytica]|uniref:Uncharacterized protein n=1 Tax=Cohnella cellulosilytica TaxID=986710 RepID=A0ABW2FN92_9BACL
MIISKEDLILQLMELPKQIAAAEDKVLQAQDKVLEAKDILQLKEDSLWLNGSIDGKNAEIRSAQMRSFTELQRIEVSDAERELKLAAVRLQQLRDRFRALRSVVDLLKGVA